MAKVQALWNAVSLSPKQNDVVDEIAGKTFIQPICTHWCSEDYAAESDWFGESYQLSNSP